MNSVVFGFIFKGAAAFPVVVNAPQNARRGSSLINHKHTSIIIGVHTLARKAEKVNTDKVRMDCLFLVPPGHFVHIPTHVNIHYR